VVARRQRRLTSTGLASRITATSFHHQGGFTVATIHVEKTHTIVDMIKVEPFSSRNGEYVQVMFKWDDDNVIQRSERGSEFYPLEALAATISQDDAIELAYEILGAVHARRS
jgi:hypothetical protein